LSSRYDPRMHAYDDQARHAGMIYILMLVVAVAFGGFVWQLYSGGSDVPRISAPSGPYRVAPSSEVQTLDAGEQVAYGEALTEPETVTPEESAVAEAEAPPADGAPRLAAAPLFVSNGPYVAQLAALQSEAAVNPAWRRISSRAPDLFEAARLDVERADLGQRGIYYRVRAGFFADRANAARFCERIRQMGQDCIVAAR
jgi:hypothetical protein